MADASWMPVAGAAVGATIALAGTFVNGLRTDRTQRTRERETGRVDAYAGFSLAVQDAHAGLREAAGGATDARRDAAARAMQDAGVYGARERLLMSGTADLVRAGEAVFERLIGIRDAIRAGAEPHGPGYHAAYHPFAEAMWEFRLAVRRELGEPPISPADVGRTGWAERDECPECASRGGAD